MLQFFIELLWGKNGSSTTPPRKRLRTPTWRFFPSRREAPLFSKTFFVKVLCARTRHPATASLWNPDFRYTTFLTFPRGACSFYYLNNLRASAFLGKSIEKNRGASRREGKNLRVGVRRRLRALALACVGFGVRRCLRAEALRLLGGWWVDG